MHEASGHGEGGQISMLQTGAAAAWRSAVVEDMECMFQLLSPKLDALGSPHETPARWEEFVMADLGCALRGKAEGFEGERCWRCVSDSQETEVPSWQGTQGTEASGSVRT